MELEKNTNEIFESIKHIDEKGIEFWYAREFMIALEYKRWDKFCNVIDSAMNACKNSNNIVEEPFFPGGKNG